jgi:class 3 adenylate cyclase/tetratricopeptide (TPR) repeat protein
MPHCPNCGHYSAKAFEFCARCGSPTATVSSREQRKRVTVFFCDVIASTALGEGLDPESLRRMLTRYFETAQQVIEAHGGTVEKFIGDAVMAVFGVPVLHEDDALRAVRAARVLRDAMVSLNEELEREYGNRLVLRIGVNTGEVVTGTEERLATGAPVNLAARLEQAAAPGEILLGAETLALVRHAVVAEPLAPLAVKGKREPVSAWRLLAVRGETGFARRFDVPMLGRQTELRRLREAFEQTQRDRSCQLVTILGAAGVGKSRLAQEFLAALDGVAVLRGRCLSYGEGITYWPVVEIVRQLEPRLAELPLDEEVLATLRGFLGPDDAMDSIEEIAFAVRRLLEAAARELPLVCVFDDIQWGEPAFLELIEQVAVLSRDAGLLLCCLARPELLERHPAWGGGKLNSATVVVEPLSGDETDQLIEHLATHSLRTGALKGRIRQAAEGNPLFVEEMIALLRDSPERDVSVPPTIHALLTARLDQLDPDERAVLQRAAVEGRVFHRGAVQALAPEETQIGSRLAALVRKELLGPDRPQLKRDDAYRFRHLLIRDVAYDSLPKATRAELHERLADWLGKRASELVEADEILGYHLEQAVRYRLELRPLDDYGRELGIRAAGLLAGAGARALGRNDVGAALKLLRRAVALRPPDDPAVALRLDLSQALLFSGQFAEAEEVTQEAAARAVETGDQCGAMRARLMTLRISTQTPSQEGSETSPSDELLALAEEALPLFEHVGDEAALTEAWLAIAWAQLIRCGWGEMLAAVDHALDHARRAGYARWERELPAWKSTALFHGPTPVDEVLDWHREQQSQHPIALNDQAVLEAMRGAFDRARALAAAGHASAEALGQTFSLAAEGMIGWEVETLAGDPSAAELNARRSCELLEQLGDTAVRSLASGQLAESLYALGRLDEARQWTEVAEELSTNDDVVSQMVWRQVRAKVLARDGKHAEAEPLAREAIRLAERTDMVNRQGHARADLAEVLTEAGRKEQAAAELDVALAYYERKGNLVAAANARRRLAELRGRAVVKPRPGG